MWSEPGSSKSLVYRVLECLRDANGSHVSGNALSSSLGVSRAAVWKAVVALRRQGYRVKAVRGWGYCLEEAPDLLLPAEVQPLLNTRVLGQRLFHYSRLDSTNTRARELARSGEPEGTVVVAEEQLAGRGRRGRNWHCPAGRGILFSALLSPVFLTPGQAPLLSLLGAVAVARLCREYLEIPAGIKWPNDVLVHGRKLAGTLPELMAEADRIEYLILGVGLNVHSEPLDFPAELRPLVTSLARETGRYHRRAPVFARLLHLLEEGYYELENRGPESLRENWRRLALGLNQEVTVSGPDQVLHGVALDIDSQGALVLEDRTGCRHRVLAGEVSLGLVDRELPN